PIIVVYPGTSPKDMEQLVVKPIESKLYDLDQIKRIKTSILNGVAVILVEYNHAVEVDDKYQELIREMAAMRAALPQNIYSIEVQKVEPSDVNVLQLALISENAPMRALKETAEGLRDELEKIPSLKNVEISGLTESLIRVDVKM